ncbi:hypothetical protein MW364_002759 [Vibrio parahaemolyticus]|nr:hypothetical protein [Vibrio parahaemolyticus]
MKKPCKILLATVILSGCSAPSATYIPPKVQLVENPPVNQIVSVGLGETMMEKGAFIYNERFTLHNEVEVSGVNLASGDFVKYGEWDGHSVYRANGHYAFTQPIANEVLIYTDKNTGSICVKGFAGISSCNESVQPIVEEVEEYTKKSLHQTLIYTGKVGNRIRFSYREFQGGIARDPFTVDVEYDLSESNIVGYKSASVDVIDATNQNITYKVLQHF